MALFDILIALVAFIVAIIILVTVHEFGHFWVAKKLGIKVLRFSIGFGKVLKSFKIGETQYTLCAIPLGGFVKMLDENEDDIDEQEQHRAFNRRNVYQRIAVVVAGPLANFALAVVLYTLVFTIGTQGIKPVVGMVENNSIAEQSGLAFGDRLLSINTNKTPSIGVFSQHFIQLATHPTITVGVLTKTGELKTRKLALSGDFLAKPEQGLEQYLGFRFALPSLKPIINQVVPSSAADLAGMQSLDEVLSAKGEAINTWHDFTELIKKHPARSIKLQVLRQGKVITLSLTPDNKNGVGKAGVSVQAPENYLDKWRVVIKKDPIAAFWSASIKTYQLSLLNLRVIKKMILGETSIKQISGPIGIANYAGKTVQVDLVSFLSFLALISIGLGLINLLPIPLLDGGHLFLYLIEILKGSALTQNTQQLLTKLGLLFIASLIFVGMYNDLLRLL